MAQRRSLFGVLAVAISGTACGGNVGTQPVGAGGYFGQEPPGETAVIFAEGVVSKPGRHEYALSISPSGDALLFSTEVKGAHSAVMFATKQGGDWSEPALVSLTGKQKKAEMEAFFAPDGETVFFAPYDEGLDVRIWRAKYADGQFIDAAEIGAPVNGAPAFYPTAANDGTLYYSNIKERKIYKAEPEGGAYPGAAPLPIEGAGHLFIASDETMALIDSRAEGGFGDSDIYVVCKNGDGTWQAPINLGPGVNSSYSETCPSLSPDGQTIFFSRYNEPGGISNIYWVSSSVLEKVKAAQSE